MKRLGFVENEFYHVYNRGVEKRVLFKDEHDYLRFIHDLFEFNDKNNSTNLSYRFKRKPTKVAEAESLYCGELLKTRKPRTLLVDILVFTLMPNHFHLLLRERKKGGITKFMHKLGTGYALHFNQRYEREGRLFQGKFKAVHVNRETHFTHLPYYIHSNPLDLDQEDSDPVKFLNSYRWSSHLDYCGWNNFPSVTQRELLLDFFGGEEQYRKSMSEWVKEKNKHIGKISDILLEKTVPIFLFVVLGLEYLADSVFV